MYTILVNDNNELITTVKERIIQRSKLVDNLHFLVSPTYKDFDMTKFNAVMRYISPVSQELRTEILNQSDSLYKDMIEFTLPFDTDLTKEAGKLEVQLTFTYVEMDADGNVYQHVRKTTPAGITIVAVPTWCNIIPDGALDAIDQKLIALDARINALDDLSAELDANKADDITYDEKENTLQLMSNNKLIGSKITLKNVSSNIESMVIDDGGNLIINYSDGRSENIGKVSGGACAGVYIPSYSDDGILTFTLSDKAGEQKYEFDIDKSNDWNPIESNYQKSSYIWEKL